MEGLEIKQTNHNLREFALNNLTKVILPYWLKNGPDKKNGGLIGEIDDLNQPIFQAPKGLILNSRVLWTFAASYKLLKDEQLLLFAHDVYSYIEEKFYDSQHGGFYWLLDYSGNPLDLKKQTYAQAFTLYGLSEYYDASGNQEALSMAESLFLLMESKCLDNRFGGYHEAFTREWKPIEDMRLSQKDVNADKTMNTHLHVLEAYSNLYKVWKDPRLKLAIKYLLSVFERYFINKKDFHLNLFCDTQWRPLSSKISYGHDIEASWLLQESAEIIEDKRLIGKFRTLAVQMTNAAMKGLSSSGSMFYEADRANPSAIEEESEWWVQAEALVGFYNAYQVSADVTFLKAALKMSTYIDEKVVNKNYGEWHNRVSAQGNPINGLPLVGFWKCPYHNTRMCLEILSRTVEN